MIAALALALLVQTGTPTAAQRRDARLEAWREALELDLADEVLEHGPALVADGGELALDGEAANLVARAWHAAGEDERARALLAEAGRRTLDGHGAAWVALGRAELALAADALEDARRSALEGARAAGDDARATALAHYLAGLVAARAGAEDEADAHLRAAVERAPLHRLAPAAWHLLAQHALRRGDTARAGELRAAAAACARWRGYHRARLEQLREDPSAPLPRLGLAQLWLEAGDAGRAERELEELVARAPDFARGWSHLGVARRRLGRADAGEALDRALELDPDDAHARYQRALLALERGDLARAEEDFARLAERGASDDPRTVEAHLALARLARAAGDGPRAEELYARYRELGGREPLDAAAGR